MYTPICALAEATIGKSSLNTIAALFCNSIENWDLAEIP